MPHWLFRSSTIILFGEMTGGLKWSMKWNSKICICLNEIIFFICSDFANIFDVDWFISYLSKDVTIIKRIPDKIMRSMEKPPYTMRPPRKSTPEYYLDQVLPILLRRRVSMIFYLGYSIKFYISIMLYIWWLVYTFIWFYMFCHGKDIYIL